MRRYTAGITQDGPALRVQLSGATFATPAQSGGTGNSFRGRLEADRALFELVTFGSYYWDFWYPDLVERIDDRTYLVVDGTASTSLCASLKGRLEGNLYIMDQDPRVVSGPLPQPVMTCWSTQHQFTLSR